MKAAKQTGLCRQNSNGGLQLHFAEHVRTGRIVRRLTPMECNGLLGYPDGGRISASGWDSKGKRQKVQTARFKALVNSIALPFWDFLAKRSAPQYLRLLRWSFIRRFRRLSLVFERHNRPRARPTLGKRESRNFLSP